MEKINVPLYLKGFEGIDWSKILLRTVIEDECSIHFSSFELLRSLFICKCIKYDFELSKTSRILCFQSYYARQSYVSQMDSFRNLEKSDLIRGISEDVVSFHGIVFFFKYTMSWYSQLKKKGLNKQTIVRALAQLSSLYRLYQLLNRLNTKQYLLLVTFCDSIIDEALITEYFKSKGILTASLQHGQYTAWRCDEFINSGVELRTLKSDYLLAWNQMTKEEAIKQGVTNTKIVIAGILGNIGRSYEKANVQNNGIFGVVINHPSFEKDNIILIQAANKLAQVKNYKYYLKLHPSYTDDYFDKYVDTKHYIGNVKKGIPILEYANLCDFSIVSSSSVFCELVYVGHRILRYSSMQEDDKFRDVPYGAIFHSVEDIVECFFGGFKEQDELNLFHYLCGVKDASREYANFLRSVLQ